MNKIFISTMILITSLFAFAERQVVLVKIYPEETSTHVVPYLHTAGSGFGNMVLLLNLDKIDCLESVSDVQVSPKGDQCVVHFGYQHKTFLGQMKSEVGTHVSKYTCPQSSTSQAVFVCDPELANEVYQKDCGGFQKQLLRYKKCN